MSTYGSRIPRRTQPSELAVVEITEAIEKRGAGMSTEDYIAFLDAIGEEVAIMKDAAKHDLAREAEDR